MAQLEKNLRVAESVYLEHGAINEAIEMYQTLYKWDEAIEVAERKVVIL
jgi:intraflagellar transport protein 172